MAGVCSIALTACDGGTDQASNIGALTATLNAHGHTDSTPGHYEFQYAADPQALGTGFGFQTPTRGPIAPNVPGNGDQAFGENVGGLSPGTKYYYRVCGGDGEVHPDQCKNTQSFTTASRPSFTSFNGANPYGIRPGPDRALWFADGDRSIGRITTAGTVSSFALPAGYGQINDLAGAFDGAIWFTQVGGYGGIGRVTTSGQFTEYPISAGAGPIVSGPDTALWFTQRAANEIGRISLTGHVTEFPLPANSDPAEITSGPDGALWFTEANGKIGRITTTGALTQYQVAGSGVSATAIVTGSDHALWFLIPGKIGRLSTSGAVTTYPTAVAAQPDVVESLLAGPDGALWYFATTCSNGYCTTELERTTTDGKSTSYTVPGSTSAAGLAAGSDGAIWLASLQNGNTLPTGIGYPGQVIRVG